MGKENSKPKHQTKKEEDNCSSIQLGPNSFVNIEKENKNISTQIQEKDGPKKKEQPNFIKYDSEIPVLDNFVDQIQAIIKTCFSQDTKSKPTMFISVIGKSKVGKAFLIERLLSFNATDKLEPVKSKILCKFMPNHPNICFLKFPGIDQFLSNDNQKNNELQQHVFDLVLEISNIIIGVLTSYTYKERKMINKYGRMLRSHQHLVVIHNNIHSIDIDYGRQFNYLNEHQFLNMKLPSEQTCIRHFYNQIGTGNILENSFLKQIDIVHGGTGNGNDTTVSSKPTYDYLLNLIMLYKSTAPPIKIDNISNGKKKKDIPYIVKSENSFLKIMLEGTPDQEKDLSLEIDTLDYCYQGIGMIKKEVCLEIQFPFYYGPGINVKNPSMIEKEYLNGVLSIKYPILDLDNQEGIILEN